ncbi:hypothetical protein ACU639_34830 [Streptomyces cynarae]|uniref:hypothetical protein n=1 Tax=Streptomyces cynarae TaxID=2981134 RepID=UPI00406C2951
MGAGAFGHPLLRRRRDVAVLGGHEAPAGIFFQAAGGGLLLERGKGDGTLSQAITWAVVIGTPAPNCSRNSFFWRRSVAMSSASPICLSVHEV